MKQIAIAVSQFFQVNHLYSNANNNGLTGRVVRDLIEAKAAENFNLCLGRCFEVANMLSCMFEKKKTRNRPQ